MGRIPPSPRRGNRRAALGFAAAALAVMLLVRSPDEPAAAPVVPPPVRGDFIAAPFPTLGHVPVAGPAKAGIEAAARPEPEAMADGGEGSVIYRRAVEAVAWIIAQDKGGTQAEGTGVLIDAERGYVLTAFHVIGGKAAIAAVFPARDGGGEIIPQREFYTHDFRYVSVPCVAVASDSTRDLALLRLVSPPHGRKAIALAATGAKPGQWLCTIGNPSLPMVMWRFGSGSVRQVYEARHRTQSGQDIRSRVVETTVPVNPGDSGGPLLDRTGRLVGINSSYSPAVNQVQQGIDLSDIRGFLRVAGVGGQAAGKE